jgi:DNA-binding transcriptional MerR regulator
MRIGELAARTGVSTKTIRFYEESGVLPEPEREQNGYRAYLPEAVGRLRFVRDAQSAGLRLDEISHILELRDQGEATCLHTIALLESHLSDVDRQIEELKRTRDRLAEMTERARALDPAACNDPNRCQTISVG